MNEDRNQDNTMTEADIPPKKLKRTLFDKIKTGLSNMSYEALKNAFMLYYTLEAPNTPVWCRTVIIGALGYFISVIDGIPDLTPFLGYTDDISVMAAAIATLATHVTPEIKERAENKAQKILAKEPNK